MPKKFIVAFGKKCRSFFWTSHFPPLVCYFIFLLQPRECAFFAVTTHFRLSVGSPPSPANNKIAELSRTDRQTYYCSQILKYQNPRWSNLIKTQSEPWPGRSDQSLSSDWAWLSLTEPETIWQIKTIPAWYFSPSLSQSQCWPSLIQLQLYSQ